MKKYNEFINEGKKIYIIDLYPTKNGSNSVSDKLNPLIGKLVKFTSGGKKIVGKLEDVEIDMGEDNDMFNVYAQVRIFNDKVEFMKIDNSIEVIKNVNESVFGSNENKIEITSPDGDEILVSDDELKKLKEMGYVYKDNSFREEDYTVINVILGNVNEDPDWR